MGLSKAQEQESTALNGMTGKLLPRMLIQGNHVSLQTQAQHRMVLSLLVKIDLITALELQSKW